jgi:hypothetical protein
MKNSNVILAALCASFVLGSAYAAEHVVLESNAVRYEAGSLLDAALPIMLENGEFVLLATEDARFLRVEGPHDGPATGDTPDESALRRALALLVAKERTQVGSVGGVRGGSEDQATEDTRAEPWLVHAERSGDQCVVRGADVALWRERADGSAQWEIATAGSERTAAFTFGPGERRTVWPATLAPQDNEIYLVRPAAAQRSVAIRLHVLEPSVGANSLAAAAWLAAKGCTAQARLLLR